MVKPLSATQRAVLAAVCDTLVSESAHTTARAEGLIASLPDRLDRLRLGLVLSSLEWRVLNLFLSARFARFTALSRDAREAVLRGMAGSGNPLRRAAFQALKRLVHVSYYCWPETDGGHPAWRAVGYPGPRPAPPPAFTPLPTLTIDRDTTLDCDIVIVGSGAGGGVAAGVLATAGRDVVVLEKGPNPGPGDFTQVEGEMLSNLYLDGGLLMTQNGSMPVLAGSCLGGGTTINYTTSFPLPDQTRAEWDRVSGLTLFAGGQFSESLARVCTRLDVGTRWSTPGARDALLERGCRTLGWHVDAIPRNVTDCREGVECGYCGYGCRHNAKNSTTKTYLQDAARHGARLVVGSEVHRVTIERGRATGVVATVMGRDGVPHALTVRARVVVAAAGAVNTPALLVRSGITNPNVGRWLRMHPGTAVVGTFPDRVEPWTGALQTRFSDQFADQGDGYGVKFETVPMHFALPASGFGWESVQHHREDMARLAHTSIVGLLLRDRDPGRVAVSRGGRPRVHYDLSAHSVERLRPALRGAAELLAAVGATEIATLQTPPVRVRPGARGWLDDFLRLSDARGYTKCRMSFISFHQMGTARIGADPRTSVCDESGQVRGVAGLYVADGSAFPASSGVNPMITIMALADGVARGIDETLRG